MPEEMPMIQIEILQNKKLIQTIENARALSVIFHDLKHVL